MEIKENKGFNKKTYFVLNIFVLTYCFCNFFANIETEAPSILAANMYYHVTFKNLGYLSVVRGFMNIFVSLVVFMIVARMGYKRSLIYGFSLIAM